MKPKHAKLNFSASHRWLACTASVCLQPPPEAVQAGPSSYAVEGTVMHEMLDKALSKEIDIDSWDIINEVIITKTHKEIVLDAFKIIKDVLDEICIYTMYTEQRVQLKDMSDMFGTADIIIDTRNKLYVMDFKSGSGLEVEAENNPQLALYGLGALEEYPRKKLELSIVQPRAKSGKKFKRWEIQDVPAFKDYWYARIHGAKGRVSSWKNDTLPSGQRYAVGDHCKYCLVESVCPERLKEYLYVQSKLGEKPSESNHIEKVLKLKDRIIDYIKAVEHAAIHRLQTGKQVSGYKLVKGQSRRKWINETRIMETIQSEWDVEKDQYVTQKLKGITDLKKIFGNEFIDRWTIKSLPKNTLVKQDDPRPEVNNLIKDFED